MEKDYRETLKELKLYSLQRRGERYDVFYCWKILEDIVPPINNCSENSLLHNVYSPRGRLCSVPTINQRSKTAQQTIRKNSFAASAAKLFNSMPTWLRYITNCPFEKFKTGCDAFLQCHSHRRGGGTSLYEFCVLRSQAAL